MALPASKPPAVSVIVSTRNRPEHIVDCVQSVLSNPGDDFEFVVVDQSDSTATRDALQRFSGDSRLHFVSTDTRGLSRSRNIAIANSRAPILAFTDDDCRVGSDWVEAVRGVMARHPDASLVFGCVVSPADEVDAGVAAEFRPPVDQEFQNAFLYLDEPWGVGANMVFRRSVFDKVGIFDSVLGAGGPFFASEDTDMTIRVLDAGLKMLYSTEFVVTHLGVRQGRDASHLMRGYGVGTGAALAKHVRLGTRGSRRVFAHWLVQHTQAAMTKVIQRKKPYGIGYIASGMWAVCRSLGYRVDRERGVYVEQ